MARIAGGLAAIAVLLLGACQNRGGPAPQTTLSPDEERARAMCEDMIGDDVRRQAGEMMLHSCMELRLREIRAGLR